jgi:hypothetical protein
MLGWEMLICQHHQQFVDNFDLNTYPYLAMLATGSNNGHRVVVVGHKICTLIKQTNA